MEISRKTQVFAWEHIENIRTTKVLRGDLLTNQQKSKRKENIGCAWEPIEKQQANIGFYCEPIENATKTQVLRWNQ